MTATITRKGDTFTYSHPCLDKIETKSLQNILYAGGEFAEELERVQAGLCVLNSLLQLRAEHVPDQLSGYQLRGLAALLDAMSTSIATTTDAWSVEQLILTEFKEQP